MEFEGVIKKCPHLVNLPSGRTLCRIYNKKERVGNPIGKVGTQHFKCELRDNVHRNYEGCPYNKEEWE